MFIKVAYFVNFVYFNINVLIYSCYFDEDVINAGSWLCKASMLNDWSYGDVLLGGALIWSRSRYNKL